MEDIDIKKPETENSFKSIDENIIKESIREVFKINPLIRKDEILIRIVYAILCDYYVEGKQYVILEAPTGIGKSVIGYIIMFCFQYIECKLETGENPINKYNQLPIDTLGYVLTSSKILQEQADSDFDRFNYRRYFSILKGTSNYECPMGTNILRKSNVPDDICYYPDRPCIGMSKEERENFCKYDCPYMIARYEASKAMGAFFNYSYFLNIFRSAFNPFFGVRKLVICDEAHLLPDIVCNQFNYELTQAMIYRLWKLTNELLGQFGAKEITYHITNDDGDIQERTVNLDTLTQLLFKLREFYYKPLTKFSDVISYVNLLNTVWKDCEKFAKNWKDKDFEEYFKKKYLRACEVVENFLEQSGQLRELEKRPEDIYFTSERISKDDVSGKSIYKHIIKDLSETELVKNHFLAFTDKVLFMSATIGNCDEFAKLIGLEEGTYSTWRLNSPFNFDKSPIYRCNVGNLKYDKFDLNIDKVLEKCLQICDELHPNEKGIIHTSTFKVQKLLMEELARRRVYTSLDFQNKPELWKGTKNIPRFLIYNTSDEKELFIDLMKTENYPFVIIGPSLYEGIDLKDDFGRFNILIKVPYAGLDDYIREKMKRYPFWYKRNTLQKITQAIGRTNRSVNDYSKVYLLDNCFEMLIWELPDYIINRLQKFYL